MLPEAQLEVMLRPLLEKRATLRAEVTGSGAVAQGDGAVAAGARGVAVGGGIAGSFVNTGRIEGNVYYGPAPDDPEKALGIYRRVLASSCGRLPTPLIRARGAPGQDPALIRGIGSKPRLRGSSRPSLLPPRGRLSDPRLHPLLLEPQPRPDHRLVKPLLQDLPGR